MKKKITIPESVNEHIKEEIKKSPEFRKAYREEINKMKKINIKKTLIGVSKILGEAQNVDSGDWSEIVSVLNAYINSAKNIVDELLKE